MKQGSLINTESPQIPKTKGFTSVFIKPPIGTSPTINKSRWVSIIKIFV